MFKQIFIFLFLIIVQCTNAQNMVLEVVDQAGNPIEKAQIINQDNQLKGLSEEDGHIHGVFNPSEKYIIRRLGYFDTTISNFTDHQKIVLTKQNQKEVTITAKKTNSVRSIGVEVIDKCELGKLACCNLAESFENSNTVDVNYSDGITGGREIQMLGLAGSYSQQLIEGTPYHRGILSKIGLELVPGPWIESIGINKGIGSVVNGYDNMSGQINIEFLKPKRNLDWFVNGYISEIAKTDINLIKGLKLKENLFTNILAHTSFSRMMMDNNHDGFTDMPIFLNLNLMNKWQYFADNGFVLNATIQATRYNSEAGQLEHTHHSSNPFIINQNHTSYQALVKTGWELDAVKEASFAVLYRLNYATQGGNIAERPIDNQQIYANISTIYQSNLASENQKLKFGINTLLNREREQIGVLHFGKTEFVNGAFGELTLKNKGMTSIFGLRGDYHNELGFFLSPRVSFILSPTENHIFKINGGFGFKTPSYLTESFGFLISNRAVQLPKNLEAEKAFNTGISYKYNYKILGANSSLEISYFLTLFQNQLIMNLETPEILKIEYLKDNSRAQNFQIENMINLNKHWSLKLSYKNDQTLVSYDGDKKLLPLLKTDKFLANLYWTSDKEKFRVSTTLLINGRARIPNMTYASEVYSPVYPIVHAQINYVPNKKMDFYIGSENIFAYNQYQRIQSAENTELSAFDAGMIWGPMDIRRMYIGGKISF